MTDGDIGSRLAKVYQIVVDLLVDRFIAGVGRQDVVEKSEAPVSR
jgi:hypothetical protein